MRWSWKVTCAGVTGGADGIMTREDRDRDGQQRGEDGNKEKK